jgi:glycosyltransferase involved in cell wall biosynthesis
MGGICRGRARERVMPKPKKLLNFSSEALNRLSPMKNALIVFPDEWLAYSPTIINIIRILRDRKWNLKVIAFDNGIFNDLVEYEFTSTIKVNKYLFYILRILRLYAPYKFIALILKLSFLNKEHDLVIGVDSVGFLAARTFFKKTTFLSLEAKRDIFHRMSCGCEIENIIIQTTERKEYLFGDDSKHKIFYVQNSPIIRERKETQRTGRKLIYIGMIGPSHGVEFCIRSLPKLGDEYSLTLKGKYIAEGYRNKLKKKYSDYLDSGRLIIDNAYTDQEHILDYLAAYDIGFCFYDLSIAYLQDFNLVSCPSGKLFNYYAAGIPVIGNSIIGLKSVNDFSAGILLDDISPESISCAIKEINRSYDLYAANGLRAADQLDFSKSFGRFLEER